MQSWRFPVAVAVALLSGVAWFWQVEPAYAGTIIVNTVTDEFGAGANCSYREAIESANAGNFGGCTGATLGADEIRFAVNGTFTVAAGSTVLDTLTIIGNGPTNTIIDGNDTFTLLTVNPLVSFTIEDVAMTDGFGVNGAAIHNLVGTVTIRTSEFTSNGGVNGTVLNDNGTLNVFGSVFTNNLLVNGGAVATVGVGGTVTNIDDTIIDNNDAANGGGVFHAGGITNINRSTLSGNTATAFGGGIFNLTTGTVNVLNSTISGNTAAVSGGGVNNFGGGTVSLLFSTLNANQATAIPTSSSVSNGGGVISTSATIFAVGAGFANCSGTVTSLGNNISDDTSCVAFFTQPGDQNNVDPELGPLADNGGPTPTHALLPGSPAIDAVVGICAVPEDQRTFGRPEDGDNNGSAVCDIGAFELEAVQVSAPSSPPVAAAAESPANDPNNDDHEDESVKGKRETEEQRQQRERTNRSNRDDYHMEGNVVGLCETDSAPPCVIVANRDGEVRVVLLGEAATAAGSIRVGDYLEADGEKIHELLFEAESVNITKPPRRNR